jgi:hypothetical protein
MHFSSQLTIREKKFNNSPLFKTHAPYYAIFDDLLRMREETLFRSAAVASGIFRINHRENCTYLLLILTEI